MSDFVSWLGCVCVYVHPAALHFSSVLGVGGFHSGEKGRRRQGTLPRAQICVFFPLTVSGAVQSHMAANSRPEGRYVGLTSTWQNAGRVRTAASELSGDLLPPSSCCVHLLPPSAAAPSKEALAKVRRLHDAALQRGGVRCSRNVRDELMAAFRDRALEVLLEPGPAAAAAERAAVAAASAALSGSVQTLTARDVADALRLQLPGDWLLAQQNGTPLAIAAWRLRDVLAPERWGAVHVTLRASLPRGGACEAHREAELQERYSKVAARQLGTQGTPEAEHAGRQLKRLRTLMTQPAAGEQQ